tara:strand:- start:1375 stop:1545 length:171 start_codon:yes stop_codon:yes gene_type:complete
MSDDFNSFLKFIRYMHKEASKNAVLKGRKAIDYDSYINSRFFWLVEQFKEATKLLH